MIDSIDLGLVKAIHIGLTAPTNTSMLWYDDNTGIKKHKFYNTVTSSWDLLGSGGDISLGVDQIPYGDSLGVITSSSNFKFSNGGILIKGISQSSTDFIFKSTDSLDNPLFLVQNNGNVSVGLSSATARVHIKGTDSTLSNYSLKIENSASDSLFSIRNDGFATIYNMNIGRGGGLVSTNTVLGVAAIANASGGQNTGVGYAVLNTLTSGGSNTAIGYAVLANITTGTTNIGIGVSAMQVSNPSYSIGIGGGVLYQSSGTGNTGIGHGNFYNLNSGNYNTALGYNAGAAVLHLAGNNNVFIGYMADVSVNNLTNAIAIGANAQVGASNSMVLGNGVNVAIGTSTPLAKLHIQGINSTSSNYALKIDNSTSSPLLYVRDDGLLSAPLLPTSNAGLATGDFYIDTAANILANGDKVIGWKV